MSMEGAPQSNSGSSGSGPVVTVKAPGATAPWKGRLIKRFKLLDELGAGAMGRVFVAEDTVIRRHVALKLLPVKHKDGRVNKHSERLVREARSAAVLEHPNVVTIHEIEEVGGVHFIAMELVEGGNLEKLVQLSGPMEIERACQLCAEAAEALAHAHQRGIIHRDVKPANLLLTRSGRCKVADFGLAVFDDVTDSSQRSRCAGSPHFIAPEVAQGQGCTEASDIYSLGCTLWYLLSGRPPFNASSSRDLLKLHVSAPLPDLRRWRPDVPPRLLEAIQKACAKNPQERFADAERFAKVLRTFTISTGGSKSATSIQPVAPLSASVESASMSAHALTPAPLAAAVPASRMPGPMVWAGAATVVTALMITLGVYIARMDRDTKPQGNALLPAGPATPAKAIEAPTSPAPVAKPAAVTKAAASPKVEAQRMPATATSGTPTLRAIDPANIVRNGMLEDLDGVARFAGWTIPERFKNDVRIIREDSNTFVRLINEDPTRNVMIEQEIDLKPTWKTLIVSVKIRASNFEPGTTGPHDCRLAITFRDDKGKRTGGWPIVPSLNKNSHWVTRKATLHIPPGAKSVLVQPAIFSAAGRVDFDDVQILPR